MPKPKDCELRIEGLWRDPVQPNSPVYGIGFCVCCGDTFSGTVDEIADWFHDHQGG